MDRRPDMKNVLLMLEGEKDVPNPPVRHGESLSSNANSIKPR